MFAKQFKYLTRAYKLTWQDVHVVLQSKNKVVEIPEEKENEMVEKPEEYDSVTEVAQHCANEAHATDEWEPMGREAIPLQETLWDYNSPEGEACQDLMVRYLLAVNTENKEEEIK
ncbi:Von Willebrand Factor A Domain-Containing Protein 3B [Manis pentadactyla]|nr:Von Willebrand Factor A Domain-Containing Protein 3B [Manis pentadactyla]